MKSNSLLLFAGVIPARYASSRFPGKPLAIIGNKPMIQRVFEQASKSLKLVYVATDDERIYSAVMKFGGKAVMTSPDHQSGTDRCAEAAVLISAQTKRKIDVIINIQGDEPFIQPEQIELLKACFVSSRVKIATLIRKSEPEDLFNKAEAKVVLNRDGDALYFSRAAIPFFFPGTDENKWTGKHAYYTHVGMYAYRSETLKRITRLACSSLEIAESLEQNRWLENGFRIRTAITSLGSMCVDTPEDLEKARLFLEKVI
jgi:3-deoxy-manno-octulosonate cytidylyltransferase (CMP-KDO synthetase)